MSTVEPRHRRIALGEVGGAAWVPAGAGEGFVLFTPCEGDGARARRLDERRRLTLVSSEVYLLGSDEALVATTADPEALLLLAPRLLTSTDGWMALLDLLGAL